MTQVEKDIALKVIEDAIHAGYSITVMNEADEITISKSTSVEKVFAELGSTGSDILRFHRDGKKVGWVWLIYGNGAKVISDYADKPEIETLLQPAFKLADKLS
jgi:hypothetical protein